MTTVEHQGRKTAKRPSAATTTEETKKKFDKEAFDKAMDEILDTVDECLEDIEAEDFVRNFIQKGGE